MYRHLQVIYPQSTFGYSPIVPKVCPLCSCVTANPDHPYGVYEGQPKGTQLLLSARHAQGWRRCSYMVAHGVIAKLLVHKEGR